MKTTGRLGTRVELSEGRGGRMATEMTVEHQLAMARMSIAEKLAFVRVLKWVREIGNTSPDAHSRSL